MVHALNPLNGTLVRSYMLPPEDRSDADGILALVDASTATAFVLHSG